MSARQFQFHLKGLLLFTAGCALILGVVVGLYRLHRSINSGLHDVYVPSAAGFLVIEHMKANNRAWPRNWEELHWTFLSVQEKSGHYRGFRWEEYPQRVGIDFAADPAALALVEAKPGEQPIHVIWSLAHPNAVVRAVDPNVCVHDYLRRTSRTNASSRQPQPQSQEIERGMKADEMEMRRRLD
jgi:hypothetical protein